MTKVRSGPILAGPALMAAVILTACTSNRTSAPAADAGTQPLTQQKAAEQCWMETEHGAKTLPLDQRAKVVDKCVKDKMSGGIAPGPPGSSSK